MVGGKYLLGYFFLSVYFFKKSVKFIFEKILFDGAGLLVNYPPKKFREHRTTDDGVTHILRHWTPISCTIVHHYRSSRANFLVKHRYLSFYPYEANSQWNINITQFWWWPGIRITRYLWSFCIAALIFLMLTPTVAEVKRSNYVGYLPYFLD